MSVQSRSSLVRLSTVLWLALLVAGFMFVLSATAAQTHAETGSFTAGEVIVELPQGERITVSKSGLGSNDRYGLREIMERAASESGSFSLNNLKNVQIAAPRKGKDMPELVPYSGNEIRSRSDELPEYLFDDTATNVSFRDGRVARYSSLETARWRRLVPTIVVTLKEEPTGKRLKVSIRWDGKPVKSGDTITLASIVEPRRPDGVTPRYSWTVNGREQPSKPKLSYKVVGKEGDEIRVLLFVSAPGWEKDDDFLTIKIGKPTVDEGDNPPSNNSDPGDGNGDSGSGGDGYGDGYGYGYGDDYGNDYGSSSPGLAAPQSVPSPPVKPKAKPKVRVDDGLMPVRGELLDPSIPAEVIDPATEQPATATEVSPAEAKSGGFGLSGGAMTAIGIGVLLGLGGVSELRAFTRFRQ